MTLRITFLVLLFLLANNQLVSSTSCECGNLYVWRFSDEVDNSAILEVTFSNLLEEILVQREECKLLERRKYATIVEHEENEKAILEVTDFTQQELDNLRSIRAEVVALGSIGTDLSSDGRIISLKFVNIYTKEILLTVSKSIKLVELSSYAEVKNVLLNLVEEGCGQQNGIEKIGLFNPVEDSEVEVMGLPRILVDLDPIDVVWTPRGKDRSITLYLENTRTGEQGPRHKVNSSTGKFTFGCDIRECYSGILSNRLPTETNHIRAVIQDEGRTYSSPESEIYVGIRLAVIGNCETSSISVVPLIDNTSIRSVSFTPEIFIFNKKGGILFEEKKNRPDNENTFRLRKKVVKKANFDRVLVMPNCYREGIDDRMIRIMYAMDNLKFKTCKN